MRKRCTAHWTTKTTARVDPRTTTRVFDDLTFVP